MRRPNPWLTVPSLLAGVLAGTLGWIVTDISCRPGSCTGIAALVTVLAFLVGGGGMLTVMVLVSRSLAEYREARERGTEPPGPGCEV